MPTYYMRAYVSSRMRISKQFITAAALLPKDDASFSKVLLTKQKIDTIEA